MGTTAEKVTDLAVVGHPENPSLRSGRGVALPWRELSQRRVGGLEAVRESGVTERSGKTGGLETVEGRRMIKEMTGERRMIKGIIGGTGGQSVLQ